MKKNLINIIYLPLFMLLFPAHAKAQLNDNDRKWVNYISLDKYLIPFWKADTICDEITQVIKDNGQPYGTLLFKARKIISVRSADLTTLYTENKDWIYKDHKLYLAENSTMPFINSQDLIFDVEKPKWSKPAKAKGKFVLFSESTFFRSKQVVVSYIPESNQQWKGPVPKFSQQSLPHALSKLQHKDNLKVVFYGNSIEVGANSSGFQKQSPFMPSWPELIIYNLKQHYQSPINFSNKAVGGKLSQWGRDNVSKLIVPENPDLTIIGFGMNDGSVNLPPSNYLENIKCIMDTVLIKNPKAEFILIAPMLANPEAANSGNQASYKKELDKLSRQGVVIADMTNVHQELLKYKRYQDMTGNNVNHPNDYLVRWYAQFISGFLIK